MAEQTVQEKLEELHKRQVEMLERRIADLEAQHHRAFGQEKDAHMEQRQIVEEHFRDRTQELTKQNDGMLGAIGRLHGENEALRKRIAELENTAKERLQQIEHQEIAVKVEMERMRHDLHEKEHRLQEELNRGKDENVELRKRLGEKVPKKVDPFKAFLGKPKAKKK